MEEQKTKVFDEEKRKTQQNMLIERAERSQRVFGLKLKISTTAEKVAEFDINPLDDEKYVSNTVSIEDNENIPIRDFFCHHRRRIKCFSYPFEA